MGKGRDSCWENWRVRLNMEANGAPATRIYSGGNVLQSAERRRLNVTRQQTSGFVLKLRLVVVEKSIGKHHGTDLDPSIQKAVLRQEVQHLRAKSADRSFFDGDEDLVLPGQVSHQVFVKGFCEPCIGNRRRYAQTGQLIGG